MKTISWTLVLFFVGLAAASAQAQAPERRKLAQGAMIQNYPCAKGWAWFYPGDKLKSCTVAVEIPFASITIPPGSIIDLALDGKPLLVQLSHDITVNGIRFQGAGLLRVTDAPVVAFYADGKVRQFFLAEDQMVDGVPCDHGGLVASRLHGDPGVVLYPDGHLKSCRLSADFGIQKKGDNYKH